MSDSNCPIRLYYSILYNLCILSSNQLGAKRKFKSIDKMSDFLYPVGGSLGKLSIVVTLLVLHFKTAVLMLLRETQNLPLASTTIEFKKCPDPTRLVTILPKALAKVFIASKFFFSKANTCNYLVLNLVFR